MTKFEGFNSFQKVNSSVDRVANVEWHVKDIIRCSLTAKQFLRGGWMDGWMGRVNEIDIKRNNMPIP